MISAVTPDGRLFTHRQEEAFRGPALGTFLRQLLRQVRGKLLVIWDGASTAAATTWTSYAGNAAAPSAACAARPTSSPPASVSVAAFRCLRSGWCAGFSHM